jgi:hypothetical protein
VEAEVAPEGLRVVAEVEAVEAVDEGALGRGDAKRDALALDLDDLAAEVWEVANRARRKDALVVDAVVRERAEAFARSGPGRRRAAARA